MFVNLKLLFIIIIWLLQLLNLKSPVKLAEIDMFLHLHNK